MPGDRVSEWRVIQRCLALLRRLLQGEATLEDLIKIEMDFEDSIVSKELATLSSRLEGDLNRLRERLGVGIRYIREDKTYRLESIDFPLIDLPEEAIEGLAFLQRTFSAPDTPYQEQVETLINAVLSMLPVERHKDVAHRRSMLEIDLRSRDSKAVDGELINSLILACNTHNEIEFVYRSPQQVDQQPRTHRVEPLRCFLDPVRRHYLLEAYCLEVNGPKGRIMKEGLRAYRLQRISELRTLPKRFMRRKIKRGGVEIVYVLSPEIARLRDVTPIIADSVITYQSDGSAHIEAVSYNLFMDLRSLLHYGANCEVIGGEDARREMRSLAAAVAKVYWDK